MGRALAGILEQVPDTERAPLDEAGLLDPENTGLPAETEVRRLVEAAGADADAAIAAARGDGDLFEGDELEAGEEQVIGGRLVEAVGAGATTGTKRYKVAVIRPGRAAGVGRRYYPARMLEAQAANFGGQPMFWNHEDLDVILKRGHGSRDPRDLCGWLQEGTWWDPDYSEPDDAKHGRRKGAVMGHTDVNTAAAELLDTFPQALAVSINMDSTKVKVGRSDEGQLAPLVEGVVKGSGSLDLITGKAGAGGKVLERLRESAELRYRPAHEDLADLDDERLLEAVAARPQLVERIVADPPKPPDPEEPVSGHADTPDTGRLVEAVLADDTARTRLVEAIFQTPEAQRIVEARVTEQLAEREDEIRAEATAESQRILDLRDLRDDAHRLIESHELLGRFPSFVEDLKSRYVLRDGRHPSPALDVHDELGEDGTVRKPARERLVEAVNADIEREVAKLREARPTVTGRTGGAVPDRLVEAREGETEEQRREREAREREAAKPKDRIAEGIGLDSEKVREYQGV